MDDHNTDPLQDHSKLQAGRGVPSDATEVAKTATRVEENSEEGSLADRIRKAGV